MPELDLQRTTKYSIQSIKDMCSCKIKTRANKITYGKNQEHICSVILGDVHGMYNGQTLCNIGMNVITIVIRTY